MARANNTGRTIGPVATGIPDPFLGRSRGLMRPPKGKPFVWLTADFVRSDAWRLRSINAVRLIDFLLAEHMNHGGRSNGALKATYDQLVEWGIPRCEIEKAVSEVERLGLVRVDRGGRWNGSNQPSLYKLTWLPDFRGAPATNEWKAVTEAEIMSWRHDRTERRAAKARYRAKNRVAVREVELA